MTTYVHQAIKARNRINILNQQLERLIAETHHMVALQDDVMGARIEKKRDKMAAYEKDIMAWENIILLAEEAINTVEHADARLALYKWYIECKNAYEIADEMGYGISNIYRLRKQGLLLLQASYEEVPGA